MKINSKYLFILKIASVLLLSLLGAWLFLKELYFSTILVFIAITSVAISMYYDRKRLVSRMERMISGIRNSDFSLHFPEKDKKDELHRLSKEMDEALQIFRNQAQSSMMDEAETEAWQKLISVLTHEIMNSIAPIISLSETLSQTAETDLPTNEDYQIMKRAMQTIHRRGEGLLVFVENYRKLTKIPEPTILPIRMHVMLASLQSLVAADNIRFSFTCYPEELVLRADQNMLEQILINLLRNAYDATKEKTDAKIKVRAEQIGEEIHIAVIDNGTGISPEAIDKIFIPFYTTKTKGSGIGLSLSRQMMLRHKGRIVVESDNKGSRVTLVFPQ